MARDSIAPVRDLSRGLKEDLVTAILLAAKAGEWRVNRGALHGARRQRPHRRHDDDRRDERDVVKNVKDMLPKMRAQVPAM